METVNGCHRDMHIKEHLRRRYWPVARSYATVQWPVKVTLALLVMLVQSVTGLFTQAADSLAVQIVRGELEVTMFVRSALMWIGLLSIIVIDYITGVIAAKRRGETIGYWGLQQTFVKWTEATMVFWAFAIGDWMIFRDMMLAYAGASWVGYHELVSIVDNSRWPGGAMRDWFAGKLPWVESIGE